MDGGAEVRVGAPAGSNLREGFAGDTVGGQGSGAGQGGPCRGEVFTSQPARANCRTPRFQGQHPLPGVSSQVVASSPQRPDPTGPPPVDIGPRGLHRFASLPPIQEQDVHRAEALPTPALLHIPVSRRALVAMGRAAILEGCVEGREEAALAGSIFYRILVQAVPMGTPAHLEAQTRLDRWAQRGQRMII